MCLLLAYSFSSWVHVIDGMHLFQILSLTSPLTYMGPKKTQGTKGGGDKWKTQLTSQNKSPDVFLLGHRANRAGFTESTAIHESQVSEDTRLQCLQSSARREAPMINVVTRSEESGMGELRPTWRLWLWEELVELDVFASYCKAIGKIWESSADFCLASRERLETKSGAEWVSAAWQNVLHVKSSQDTINKKDKKNKTKQLHTFHVAFVQFLTYTPQTSRRPPSWAGSQGLGAHLLSLSLWIAHTCFCSLCRFKIKGFVPEKAVVQTGPTWIFASFVPLDEAHDEQDQDKERDGAHQPDEPPLSGNVHLPAGCSCGEHRGSLSAVTDAVSLRALKLEALLSPCWATLNLTDAETEI